MYYQKQEIVIPYRKCDIYLNLYIMCHLINNQYNPQQ